MKYFIIILSSLLLVGCFSTIAPKPIISSQSGFSGSDSNGGILGIETNSYGKTSFVILNKSAIDKYNGLIKIYSKKFIPYLKKNDGVIDLGGNKFKIDSEHLSDFALMVYFYKNNIK